MSFQVVFFTNSGTEANELAMMIARLYTGFHDIISLRNAYHGNAAATMSATAQCNYKFNVVQVYFSLKTSLIFSQRSTTRCYYHLVYHWTSIFIFQGSSCLRNEPPKNHGFDTKIELKILYTTYITVATFQSLFSLRFLVLLFVLLGCLLRVSSHLVKY